MRITHIVKSFYPEKNGIATVVDNLIQTSLKNGGSGEVITFSSLDETSEYEANYPYTIRRHPPITNLKNLALARSYFNLLSEIDSDIIHLHTPNPVGCWGIRHVPQGIPVLISHHSDFLESKMMKLLCSTEISNAYNRAMVVIASSMNYAATSSDLSWFKDKVKIIPNGVKTQSSYHPRKYKPDTVKTILAIGPIEPYKGFDYLIKGMRFVENAKLVVIGEGSHLPTLRELSNGDKCVTFTGDISENEKTDYLQKADLLCLPAINRKEAFGVSLLEALAHALPVVTSNIVSGMNFVNIDNFTGLLVPPKKPRLLGEAINQVLSDAKMYEKFSKNALAWYFKRFTAERMGESYMGLYKKIIANDLSILERGPNL